MNQEQFENKINAEMHEIVKHYSQYEITDKLVRFVTDIVNERVENLANRYGYFIMNPIEESFVNVMLVSAKSGKIEGIDASESDFDNHIYNYTASTSTAHDPRFLDDANDYDPSKSFKKEPERNIDEPLYFTFTGEPERNVDVPCEEQVKPETDESSIVFLEFYDIIESHSGDERHVEVTLKFNSLEEAKSFISLNGCGIFKSKFYQFYRLQPEVSYKRVKLT